MERLLTGRQRRVLFAGRHRRLLDPTEMRPLTGQEATVTSDRFVERDRCASRLSAGGSEAIAIAELLDVPCNPRRP